MDKIRFPLLALIVLSGVSLLLFAAGPIAMWLVAGATPEGATVRAELWTPTILAFMLLIPNAVVCWAAYRGLYQKSYRSALVAAIVSALPIVSPLMYLGMPFGIWLLILLTRREVRSSFSA